MEYSIVLETEGGRLAEADARARELLRRRPSDARAHFAQAYVLRYAGLLEEAARHCDAARATDPENREFRSCSEVFTQLGEFEKSRSYIALDDPTSRWRRNQEAEIRIREGNPSEAARLLDQTRFGDIPSLIRKAGSQADRDRTADGVVKRALEERDPENRYGMASWLAASGYSRLALELLRQAVEANYLCVPAMDRNVTFDSIRKEPEFAAIRDEALRRQKEFVARHSGATRS
jgi:tetratricopeptide (TPR) repeat protein